MPKVQVKIQEPKLTTRPKSEKTMREWEKAHLESLKAAVRLVACQDREITAARALRLRCPFCRSIHKIGKWEFIQRHAAGSSRDGNKTRLPIAQCEVACPRCERSIRILDHPRGKSLFEIAQRSPNVFEKLFARIYDQFDDHCFRRVVQE